MPPDIAPTKSAAAWGRPSVEATIRAWYNFMAIESGDLKLVKEEWEARFDALPSDTDASQIAPEFRLRWRDLPTRSSRGNGTRPENQSTARQRSGPLDGVSDALENPPINPLAGHGRTSADVARDTRAWQDYVRARPNTLTTPVFQSDYLFVQAPNQSLQLHRVASGAFIEDAVSPDIIFQTAEYVQTPNPCIGGFWGEFTPKPNKNYNPSNKKMGGQFVRHNEISREHIKGYNVRVVVVKKPPPPAGQKPVTYIRVLAASLIELAKVCPEFVVPDPLPSSHEDDDITAPDNIPSDPDEEDPESDEEDPPPPIPDGYTQVPAASLSSVTDFLMWSRVGADKVAAWHRGVTVKTHPPNFLYRGKPFTHDAKLGGSNNVRGVNLTPELEAEGMWVAITCINPVDPLPGASPNDGGRAPRASRRRR